LQAYSYEICPLPLPLMDVNRLSTFETVVRKRTFGPKREELTNEWIKVYKAEFYNFILQQVPQK
jgi:hypothetical protein